MSEQLHPKQSGETLRPIDTKEHAERLKANQESQGESAPLSAEHIDSLRDAVDAAAQTVEHSSKQSEQNNDSRNVFSWSNAETKQHAYSETLRKVRRHLTKSEKSLSKVVHQPTVERVSEVGAKIARPSGILIGAMLSFCGSLLAYILTKMYGYNLPNSIFSMLFVGGFVVGILSESAIKLIQSIKRH